MSENEKKGFCSDRGPPLDPLESLAAFCREQVESCDQQLTTFGAFTGEGSKLFLVTSIKMLKESKALWQERLDALREVLDRERAKCPCNQELAVPPSPSSNKALRQDN